MPFLGVGSEVAHSQCCCSFPWILGIWIVRTTQDPHGQLLQGAWWTVVSQNPKHGLCHVTSHPKLDISTRDGLISCGRNSTQSSRSDTTHPLRTAWDNDHLKGKSHWAIWASVPHSGRLRGWPWQLLQAQAAMQFLENFQEGAPNYRVRQLLPFPNLRHVLTSGLCFRDSDGHGLNWRCIFIDSYISHRSLIYIYEHCAIYKNRMEPSTS